MVNKPIYLPGMCDSTGARLCTYNPSDHTWIAVRGREILSKWEPKGYLLTDHVTRLCLEDLSKHTREIETVPPEK